MWRDTGAASSRVQLLRRSRRSTLQFDCLAAFRHEQIARFLAKQRNRWLAVAGLVMRRIKFLRWELGRCWRAGCIAFPQNRPQTPVARATEISHDLVDLLVGNFRRDAVHSRLSIQRF